MNVASFDASVRAYIALLRDRDQIMYAARYAHYLVHDPERATELAEAEKRSIRASRRAVIRRDILSFNTDGRL